MSESTISLQSGTKNSASGVKKVIINNFNKGVRDLFLFGNAMCLLYSKRTIVPIRRQVRLLSINYQKKNKMNCKLHEGTKPIFLTIFKFMLFIEPEYCIRSNGKSQLSSFSVFINGCKLLHIHML
jgi:hypothetical protein